MTKQTAVRYGLLLNRKKSLLTGFIAGVLMLVGLTGIYTYRDTQVAYADAINTTDFVTTWTVLSSTASITIPTTGTGYNYNVDWNNDGVPDQTGLTGNVSHTYGAAGTYTIRISGTFPRFYHKGLSSNSSVRLVDINQWGTNQWTSMEGAFTNAYKLATISATDTPDLSHVTSMKEMFYGALELQADLSAWDVSTITNMKDIFGNTNKFNSDLSTWDVSNVTDMGSAFYWAKAFNRDLSHWNVGNVTNMNNMFGSATAFNGNISSWDVSKVQSTRGMFQDASAFAGDLSQWNVSNVTDMSSMFYGATTFNGDISNWNVSNVTNMSSTFSNAVAFNSDLSQWDVSKVTSMSWTFGGASSFNSDLSQWDVSNVNDMSGMFYGTTAFNSNISNWDVSNVEWMEQTFQYATSFKSDLSRWDMSNVRRTAEMFYGATAFNSDLSRWDMSAVDYTWGMFYGATSFTSDVSQWKLPDVASIAGMFTGASAFSSNLGSWDLSILMVTPYSLDDVFANSGMTRVDYDATLAGWAAQAPPAGLTLNASGLKYCRTDARDKLISDYGWTITGDSQDCTPVTPSANVKSGTSDLWNKPTITKRPTFVGHAEPFATITVTAHSDPVTCTTTADITGSWSCTLPSDLEPGEHTVYVTVTLPNNGEIQHLGPYTVTVATGATTSITLADTGDNNLHFLGYGLLLTAAGTLILLRKRFAMHRYIRILRQNNLRLIPRFHSNRR